jgi:hypothetical protein
MKEGEEKRAEEKRTGRGGGGRPAAPPPPRVFLFLGFRFFRLGLVARGPPDNASTRKIYYLFSFSICALFKYKVD